jgi:DNA (cytosine-5)-methyltransferase 1
MTTFYNEWDKKTAAWLRELARQGHVTNGVVDERSITELRGEDLRGYGRVHLFAGIGGWDYALRLAGWPDDRPVWTGSCPCQPFSAAGKRKGQADERHLWPEMFRLIRECRPDTIFGEQVASAVGHGWIDGVFADLEGIGYTCGAVVLGAHSVGAPHMRQRLWWVADSQGGDGEVFVLKRGSQQSGIEPRGRRGNRWATYELIPCGDGKTRRIESGLSPLVDGVPGRMVIMCANCKAETTINENLHYMRTFNGRNEGRSPSQILLPRVHEEGNVCSAAEGRARTGKATYQGRVLQQVWSNQETSQAPQGPKSTEQLARQHRNPLHEVSRSGTFVGTEAVSMRGLWDAIRGKGSQVESQDMFCKLCKVVGPHLCREAMGGSRITELRGYGNAIVPQVAAAFVRAFMESEASQ